MGRAVSGSSMLADVAAGRVTEAEWIYGAAGVATPVNRVLYNLVRHGDEQRAARAASRSP